MSAIRLDRVLQLARAAQEAWTIWDQRPALILGDKVNPRSRNWMMAQRVAMKNLGAALLLAGADLRTPREGEDSMRQMIPRPMEPEPDYEDDPGYSPYDRENETDTWPGATP